MPSLFSTHQPARHLWRLLPALLLYCLTACQQGSAPVAAPNGGGAPPPASAPAAPPRPATSPPPAAVPLEPPKPAPVAKNGAKPPKTSAKPPAASNGPGSMSNETATASASVGANFGGALTGGALIGGIAGGVAPSIPRFSWPPPKASAQQAIPDKWLRTGPVPTLASVADKFEKALKLAGYAQRSYYEVPHGFALATQLEHIRADGTPLPGDDRWKVGPPRVGNLTLLAFIEALAHAPAGIYRAIVFVVTDAPWVQSPTAPSDELIMAWAGGGAASLPAYIGSLPYGDAYRAHALIYEFRKGSSGPAETILPSAVSGEIHLDRGGLWDPLSIL